MFTLFYLGLESIVDVAHVGVSDVCAEQDEASHKYKLIMLCDVLTCLGQARMMLGEHLDNVECKEQHIVEE